MGIRKEESISLSKYNILTFLANNIGVMVPFAIIASIYIFRMKDGLEFSLGEVYFLISLCSMLMSPTLTIMSAVSWWVKSSLSFARCDNFMQLDFEKSQNRSTSMTPGTVILEQYSATWLDHQRVEQLKKLDPSS